MLIIAVIGAFLVVVVLLVVAFAFYQMRIKRFNRVVHLVSGLSNRHSELSKRAKLVETSAVGYVNSIGKDGADLLDELQKKINQAAYLIEELESLLITGDTAAVTEVEMFLCNDHPRQMSPESGFDGTVRFLRFDPDWDIEIEGILQRLGESVSQASIAATAVGIPKNRERTSTLMNLLDAGIDLISVRKDETPKEE